MAQTAPAVAAAGQEDGGGQHGDLAFFRGIGLGDQMLGDLFGLRTALAKIGVTFTVQDVNEVFANATGGLSTQPAYDGVTQFTLQFDTEQAFGLSGGLLNASALLLRGYNISTNNLLQLQIVSDIAGEPALRLWELWYQQKLLSDDRLDVRVGQQSLDQEFMISQNSLYFINAMSGWPMVPSADLPGGGPAYPLSMLGARVRYRPTDSVMAMAGLYNGSPTWTSMGNAQFLNPSGTYFGTGDGVFLIFELQFSNEADPSDEDDVRRRPLGGTYKIGAWYNSLGFNDLRYDNTGLSLANPNSTGAPMTHSGNYSLYAVADQVLWRDGRDPTRSLNAFARAMWTPQSDRNLIDFSLNAGLIYHNPLPNRPDDVLGFSVGYAHVSAATSGLDADTIFYNQQAGTPVNWLVRRSETFFELTYIAQVKRWWQIQPDFQYVFNPGGGLVNPNNPTQAIANEFIAGIRTTIQF